jgi:hypothetical protein
VPIIKSAVHPKARLKYRLINGKIVQYEKHTPDGKCLGWRPSKVSSSEDVLDANVRELLSFGRMTMLVYFHHWRLSADHSRWSPSDAAADLVYWKDPTGPIEAIKVDEKNPEPGRTARKTKLAEIQAAIARISACIEHVPGYVPA